MTSNRSALGEFSVKKTVLNLCALAAFIVAGVLRSSASETPLASLDYTVVGHYLKVSPAAVAVPKGIAGSVLVTLANADGSTKQPDNALTDGAHIEAVLRGPSFPARRLIGQVGQPLMLPALNLVGDYRLDGIRLVDSATGEVRMEGLPSSVPVSVFAEVLVSRVTSRPLSLQEIQDKGIAIDDSNFRAVEFEVGFVLDGQTYPIKFPVVTPDFARGTEIIPAAELEKRLVEAQRINDELSGAAMAALPPELETAGLNLVVKGCNFELATPEERNLRLSIPPIPALMVIPGNIGYLNQFFSVQIYTENAAPENSGLSVLNLTAKLVLPPGGDQVPAPSYDQPGDDPLRFARVGPNKIIQAIQPIVRPGADGVVGTADDILRLYPKESGQAEFLVEGLREGLHLMDLELNAELDGLAGGLVKIKGRAAGSVLVRNPKFSLTFSHPRTVRTGEPYDAFVTVLNTSQVDANLVRVTLPKGSVSGATLLDESDSVPIGNLAPGQSATARFRLRAERTGKVTFSNLTTGEDSVTGRFRLTMGVDERGVELSPDSIGFPDYVDQLPEDVFYAANRVLGQALSVYTAPLLPPGVKRVPWSIIQTRVLELAEAGQRVAYGEPLARVLPDLALDWQGGRKFSEGFDQIVANTEAGQLFRAALGRTNELADGLTATARLVQSAADLAGRGEAWVLVASDSGAVVPEFQNATGAVNVDAATLAQAAGYRGTNGHWLAFKATNGVVRWTVAGSVTQTDLAVLTLTTNGTGQLFRWTVAAPSVGSCLSVALGQTTLTLDAACDGSPDGSLAATVTPISERPPELLAARQLWEINSVRPKPSCYPGAAWNYGTIVGVLFSKPMTQTNASQPLAYRMDNGIVAGAVQIQPGGRVALLNLREGIGAIRPRVLTVHGVADPRGNLMVSNSLPVTELIREGVAVSGRVVRADGSPAVNVPVTLTMNDLYKDPFDRCDSHDARVSQEFTDENGAFSFDFVLAGVPYTISATDIGGLSQEAATVILNSIRGSSFDRERLLKQMVSSNILATLGVGSVGEAVALGEGLDRAVWTDLAPHKQGALGHEVTVALRFRGRGTVQGRIVQADGSTPAAQAAVNLFADPASREKGRGVFAANDGTFTFYGVPLGTFTLQVKTAQGQFRTIAGILNEVGEVADLQIQLTAPTTEEIVRTRMHGIVTESDNATPHDGAQVFVRGIHGVVGVAETDESGYWEVSDVPVDTYAVFAVSVDGKRKAERAGIVASVNVPTYVALPLSGTATVTGRVENSAGDPVANALVAGGSTLVRTDASGVFHLTGVPLGLRQLHAGLEAKFAPNNFPRLGSATLEVLPGVENFTVIRLRPAGVITGQVKDAQGAPVTGINVAIPFPKGFQWTKVDDNGFYRFINVAPGEYTVSAPAPPVTKPLDELMEDGSEDEIMAAIGQAFALYAGANLNTNINPGSWGYTKTTILADGDEARANINYFPKGSVSGVVLNDQAIPIGARVRLTGLGRLENGAPGFVVLGDQNSDAATGEFRFGGQLMVGDWGVQAASPFYTVVLSTSGRTTETELSVTNLVLQFPPRRETHGRLVGRVVDPDGVAVANAEVSIPFGGSSVELTTAIDGAFTNQLAMPAGSYNVQAFDPATGYRGSVIVGVVAGLTNRCEIPLLGLGELELVVRQGNGQPAGNAFVRLEKNGAFREVRDGVTDASGVFRSGNLIPGNYSLIARHTVGANIFEGRVGLDVFHAQLTRTNLTLGASAGVRGTFRRLADGSPISSARVAIGSVANVPTDANGVFEAIGLPLGTYRVIATDQVNGRSAVGSVSLSFADQMAVLNLVEQPQGELRGTVFQTGKSAPVAGAEVSFVPRTGIGSRRSVTTAADGSFSFPGITPGDYSLDARLQGLSGNAYVTGTFPETSGSVTVNLTLPAEAVTGQLHVTVLRPDGSPAGNARVLAGAFGGGFKDTDPNGVAYFDGLGLGTVRVRANSLLPVETFSVAETNLALTASAVSNAVTVRLRGVGAVRGQVFNSLGTSTVPFPTLSLEMLTDPYEGQQRVNLVGDANGAFTIGNIPVGAYRIVAESQALSASTNGVLLVDGQTNLANLVLAPSGIVIGRVVRADGSAGVPTNNVVLKFASQSRAAGLSVRPTDPSGRFGFTNVPLGALTLEVNAPRFAGLIKQAGLLATNGQVLDLGDLRLDEDVPFVTGMVPAHTSAGVPVVSPIDVIFSEPMLAASITGNTNAIFLKSPTNVVSATVALVPHPDDARLRVARLTPAQPLRSLTTYDVIVIAGERRSATGSLIASGPTDLVGRPLGLLFLGTFTTRDDDPPLLVSLFPTNTAENIDPLSVVRLTFNEPLRTTNLFVSLNGPLGPVAGSTALSADGKILVFTPTGALLPNRSYTLTASNLIDLAGNRLVSEPVTATFQTVDTVGPVIATLRVNGPAVAGTSVPLEAVLAAPEAGASVRFFQALTPIGSAETAPYVFAAKLPDSGTVRFQAIATDRFGNDGEIRELDVTVVSNQPPVVSLVRVTPTNSVIGTGQELTLTLSASDDNAVTNLTLVGLGAIPTARTFSNGTATNLTFTVPATNVAGTLLQFRAQATDSSGATSSEALLDFTVTDATRPTLAYVSPAANAVLDTAQPLLLTVALADNGTQARVKATLSGLVSSEQETNLVLAPGVNRTNVFAFSITNAPQNGGTIFAQVTVTDAATNSFTLNRSFVVIDTTAPRLTSINPTNGTPNASLWNWVEWNFSETVRVPGDVTNFVRLTNELGEAAVAVVDQGGSQFRLRPTQALRPGVVWTNYLFAGVTDTSSNALRLADGSAFPTEGLRQSFRTAAILSRFPTNGAKLVSGQRFLGGFGYERGLNATWFSFGFGTNAPKNVQVAQAATNVVTELNAPTNSGPVILKTRIANGSGFTSAWVPEEIALEIVARDGDDDGDGWSNGYEADRGMDPFRADADEADFDLDGLSNATERTRGTDPAKADTDDDGLNDGAEIALGTNPLNPDTDGDGLMDGVDPAPLSASSGLTFVVSPTFTVQEGQFASLPFSVSSSNAPITTISFGGSNGVPAFVTLGSIVVTNTATNGTATGEVRFRPLFSDAGTYEITLAATGLVGTNAVAGSTNLLVTVLDDASIVVTRWKDAVSGNFSDTNRWTDGLPGTNRAGVVDLPGNYTVTLNADAVIGDLAFGASSGTQTFLMANRALTVNGGLQVRNGGLLQLNSGQINGAGSVHIASRMNWTGGQMNGAGSTTVGMGALLAASGMDWKYCIGRTLNNAGTITFTGTGGLTLGAEAVLNNDGLIEFSNDQQIHNAVGGWSTVSTINNRGTIRKVAGLGIVDLSATVNNHGTIAVESGGLEFGMDGSSSGAFQVAAGSTLYWSRSTHHLAASARVQGGGNVQFSGGTVNFDGLLDVDGSVNATGGIAVFRAGARVAPIVSASLGNSSARLEFNTGQEITLGTLTQRGSLRGSDTVVVTNHLEWLESTMEGSGATRITPEATLTIGGSSYKWLIQRRLVNEGTAVWNSTSGMTIGGGSVLENRGTFEIQNDEATSTAVGGWATSGFIENFGVWLKTGGTNTTSIDQTFSNHGEVQVLAGTLRLDAGGTNSGSFLVASNASFRLQSGTHRFETGSSVTGEGVVRFSGGTASFDGLFAIDAELTGGTAAFNGTGARVDRLFRHNGGTLSGTGDLTVFGRYDWSSGSMGGTGRTVVRPGGQLNLIDNQFNRFIGRQLVNGGTMTLSNGVALHFSGGSLLNEATGELLLPGAANFWWNGGSPGIVNQGLITKTGTALVVFQASVPFENTGTVRLLGGTTQFKGTGQNAGLIEVATGASASFEANFAHPAGSRIEGGGSVAFNGGTHELFGSFQPLGDVSVATGTVIARQPWSTTTPIHLGNGTLRFETDQTLRSLAMSGSGTLAGAGTLTVTNSLAWLRGSMEGTGRTVLAADATTILGTNGAKFLQRRFDNAGRITVPDATTLFLSGGVLHNLADGEIEILDGLALTWNGGSGSFLRNAGTVTKLGTNGLVLGGNVPLDNSGVLELLEGFASFGGANGTNAGSILAATGTELSFNAAMVHPAGSRIEGLGRIRFTGGNHNLLGQFLPTGPLAVSGGVVTVNNAIAPSGTLAITNNGSIRFETPQSFGDVLLNTTGDLGGTADVTMTNLFRWNGGELSSGGRTLVASNAMLQIGAGANKFLNRVLENHGTTTVNTQRVWFTSGAFRNHGTLDLNGEGEFRWNGGSANRLENFGIVTKTGTNAFGMNSVWLNNAGDLRVLEGSLTANLGGTNSGRFLIETNAAFSLLGSSPLVLQPGTEFAGRGQFVVESSARLTLQTNVQFGALQVVFRGPSAVSGAFEMANTEGGSITFERGQTLAGSLHIGGRLETTATNLTLVLNGNLTLEAGSQLINPGRIEVKGDYTNLGADIDGNAPVKIGGIAPTGLRIVSVQPTTSAGRIPQSKDQAPWIEAVLQWNAPPGQAFEIEATGDFTTWSRVEATVEETASGQYRARVSGPATEARFFRTRRTGNTQE